MYNDELLKQANEIIEKFENDIPIITNLEEYMEYKEIIQMYYAAKDYINRY